MPNDRLCFQSQWLCVICIIHLNTVYAESYCFTGDSIDYCHLGCCGDGPIQHCCGFTPMAIVGLVVGILLMLASLVCCGFCIYYMCKKRSNNVRTVPVQPYNNTNSVYVHNAPYGHPPPHAAPPSYNQYNSYPGRSSQPPGYNDSSYPPGTVSSEHPPPSYKL